ncbi:hypothetical protein JZ751_026205, partial [Albula glossodonta]
MKLRPFFPSVSNEFLSCLSTKDFSCETYQAVVRALSEQISSLDKMRQRTVYSHFIYLFLSRNDTSDTGCLSNTDGSTDWLETNFGNFSVFAPLDDLLTLNENFSSFDALPLLTPSQAAELTLSSGALYNTDQIDAVFDRLETEEPFQNIDNQAAELTLSSGALYNTDQIDAVFDRLETEEPFQNIDEYLTQLSKHPELPEISPAVKDIMMNRTFHIIDEHFPQFESQDWTAWFHVKLIPILASFQAEMLAVATSEANCTNYQIIVGGVSKVSGQMTQSRKQEIAQVLLDNLKESVLRFSEPACREDIKNDADFLQVNLGSFSKDAPYSELKALNITGLEVLDALSPTQKVDLLLDPSLDALENETTVRIVFSSIVESPEEEELDEFFEAFVEATAQENRTIIENPDVRDTMLNLTLKALAPRFPTFEASDFALWFQVYLVVLLPSFHPESLLLIPMDISCDSYHAILKGLDQSLASLPFELQQGIKSSKDILTQKVPKRCTVRPVVGECEETPVDEMDLCAGVNSHPLELNLTSEEFSGILCAFSLESYACSSTQLTAENLATLLKCKLSTNLPYSTALWKLFFMKMSDVLAEALFEYAGMTSNINGPLVPEVLDAIGEIQINKFSEEELKNVSFIKKWFEMKLRPFFPSVSNEFLSCLSTKDFSCETYQAVVRALSEQISSLDKMRQRTVYSHFIYLFLSRNDTSAGHQVKQGHSDTESSKTLQGHHFHTQSSSFSHCQSQSQNSSVSHCQSQSQSSSVSYCQSQSQNSSVSHCQSQSQSSSVSYCQSQSQNSSVSHCQSQSQSSSVSYCQSQSQNSS